LSGVGHMHVALPSSFASRTEAHGTLPSLFVALLIVTYEGYESY
jgi:hypothetical protein